MPTKYFNRANVDFELLFEPDAAGVTIPGFYAEDGSLLKFASIANGSKIADVEHYHSSGPDVTNYWAGKGTVSYTAPVGNVGIYVDTSQLIQSVGWSDRLTSSMDLVMKADGTWEVWRYGTNWRDDTRASGGQNIINPGVIGQAGPAGSPAGPVGVLYASGNWLQAPGAGKGASYTMDVTVESTEWGRTDYYAVPPTTWRYDVAYHYGNFNTDVGTVTGTGTDLALSTDRRVSGLLDQTPVGNNYTAVSHDANGGLSRYWRGQVRVRVKRNGVEAMNFLFLFHTQNRWINSDDMVGTGGGGGGTGGGGVGGCVSVDSYIYGYKPVVAGELGLGNTLTVTDPYLADTNSTYGEIRYVQRSLQPLVRLRTASGAQLTCSDTAPIATKDAGYVLAPNLLGHFVPVATKEQIDRSNTSFIWDEVVSVEDAGMGWVQRINVDNRAFWAGDDGELFVLHHNLKTSGGTGST